MGLIHTQNRFDALREEDEAEGEVCAINESANAVVEITVDSGASKSVWPMTRTGVTRRSPRRT